MKRRPIEIGTVTRGNLLSCLDAVRGCWKATTMLWMHAVGIPVLSGVIVPNWSDESASALRNFSRRKKLSQLLLRIDKPRQRWTARRGGYLLPVSEAKRAVKELTREEMIAIFLEPASPYCNHYALGALAIPDEGKVVVEVVGPGFDASDILRSDLQPHERFELNFASEGQPAFDLESGRSKRTYLTDSVAYQKSVEQRLVKIGARLRNPAFPNKVLEAPNVDRNELRGNAMEFLGRSGQGPLLKHLSAYKPVPAIYFSRFVRGVSHLLNTLASYGIHLGATSISGSVVSDRRLIFWDFFPAKNIDTTALTPKGRSLS